MHDIRGCGRTSIGDIDVRPKRLGTYIRRACHYRGTSSRLPWNARSTGVSRSAHSSGNPDGAIRSVSNAYRIAPAQSLEGERLNGIHHRDKLRSVCHASTLRVVRHLLRIIHFLLHELGMNDILTVLVFAGRAMLYVTDWSCSSWHNLIV